MLEKGAITASQASPAFPNNGEEIIPSKGRGANISEAEASAWQPAEGLFTARSPHAHEIRQTGMGRSV